MRFVNSPKQRGTINIVDENIELKMSSIGRKKKHKTSSNFIVANPNFYILVHLVLDK